LGSERDEALLDAETEHEGKESNGDALGGGDEGLRVSRECDRRPGESNHQADQISVHLVTLSFEGIFKTDWG